jgi:mono/diheme cytochrome c family protein
MRSRRGAILLSALGVALALSHLAVGAEKESAAERGRQALTSTGYLRPSWGEAAYPRAGRLWENGSPDPQKDPAGYAASFNRRYGLHTAPYPNDGLPMGLRRGNGRDGRKTGLQIDCLVCHGGSIGGKSYVGLGNTQLDLKALLNEMTRADGHIAPPSTFILNSARGTVNAGMVAAVLLSFRNPDLSRRVFPLPLGANLPELDVPPWWHLRRKATMYYDGRIDARSVRSNMTFLLGEKSLDELKALEPTFRDIQAYLESLTPPKYPFAVDTRKAARGRAVFARRCAKCHGTHGPDGQYPNLIVELKVIGTDPARALGLSERMAAHYNATWFGESEPFDDPVPGYQAPPLDGIWATAPYLHNGSVPTLAALLNSSTRPARFKRPTSTDFEHYDRENVGWKYEVVGVPLPPTVSAHEARFVYDNSRFGLGNGGHTFGDKLSDADRSDLIEYLKTL